MILLPLSAKIITDTAFITAGTLTKYVGIHMGLSLLGGFLLMFLIEELLIKLFTRRVDLNYSELYDSQNYESKLRQTTTAICNK